MAGDFTSDDEYLSGGFSDADDDRPLASNIGGAFFLERMAKSPELEGKNSNLRRLTSRSRDERAREKTPPQPTPRMPTTGVFPKAQGHADAL